MNDFHDIGERLDRYDDPDAWVFEITGNDGILLGYDIELRLRDEPGYLPSAYTIGVWHAWTAKGAIAKAGRILERHKTKLRRQISRQVVAQLAMKTRRAKL